MARAAPASTAVWQGARRSEPQRATGELAVIEPGGAIQLRYDRRKFEADAPLVRASARRLECRRPWFPPSRDEARNRLDDEHAIALPTAVHELVEQCIAFGIRELVERVGRDERRRPSWQTDSGRISLLRR